LPWRLSPLLRKPSNWRRPLPQLLTRPAWPRRRRSILGHIVATSGARAIRPGIGRERQPITSIRCARSLRRPQWLRRADQSIRAPGSARIKWGCRGADRCGPPRFLSLRSRLAPLRLKVIRDLRPEAIDRPDGPPFLGLAFPNLFPSRHLLAPADASPVAGKMIALRPIAA
jgi:hypothetical protein